MPEFPANREFNRESQKSGRTAPSGFVPLLDHSEGLTVSNTKTSFELPDRKGKLEIPAAKRRSFRTLWTLERGGRSMLKLHIIGLFRYHVKIYSYLPEFQGVRDVRDLMNSLSRPGVVICRQDRSSRTPRPPAVASEMGQCEACRPLLRPAAVPTRSARHRPPPERSEENEARIRGPARYPAFRSARHADAQPPRQGSARGRCRAYADFVPAGKTA